MGVCGERCTASWEAIAVPSVPHRPAFELSRLQAARVLNQAPQARGKAPLQRG